MTMQWNREEMEGRESKRKGKEFDIGKEGKEMEKRKRE